VNPNLTPGAPQGPSDEELNRVPPDPVILPFGGGMGMSNALYGYICGPPSPVNPIMRGTLYDHNRIIRR
jgi:hypothetical protein